MTKKKFDDLIVLVLFEDQSHTISLHVINLVIKWSMLAFILQILMKNLNPNLQFFIFIAEIVQ